MAQSVPARLIAFLTCAVALIIGLIALAGAHRKATYHGRSLLEWRAAAFDTSAGVRDTAAYALTRLEPASPRELAAMIRAETVLLADDDSDVRADATSALVALRTQSPLVVPMVAAIIDRPSSPNVRLHAIQVLAALGPDAAMAVPVVTRALSDTNASVRLVAVTALGRLGGHGLTGDQIDVVVHATTDTDADVRAAAIEALVALDAPHATLLQVAERAATDPDAGVRTEAAYALAATNRGPLTTAH